MYWIKNFSFLKKNLLRLLHISSILKMCLSPSFIMSSAQLSGEFQCFLQECSGSRWEIVLLAQN